MVIHSAICKILCFHHGFCTPQNSSLPAVTWSLSKEASDAVKVAASALAGKPWPPP